MFTKAVYDRNYFLQRSTVDTVTGCWVWNGRPNSYGYGYIRVGSEYRKTERRRMAHRVAYETLVGPIPDGLVIDHLCRNRRCVNPDHLEPVTNTENLRRGEGFIGKQVRTTHCPKGHEYNEANTRVSSDGQRHCRVCHRERQREKARQAGHWPKRAACQAIGLTAGKEEQGHGA